MESRKCTDYDTCSTVKNPLPFIPNIIQSRQLAPTGDPQADADVAIQAYFSTKQLPGEPTHRYRIRTEYMIKVIERLGLEVSTPLFLFYFLIISFCYVIKTSTLASLGLLNAYILLS